MFFPQSGKTLVVHRQFYMDISIGIYIYKYSTRKETEKINTL